MSQKCRRRGEHLHLEVNRADEQCQRPSRRWASVASATCPGLTTTDIFVTSLQNGWGNGDVLAAGYDDAHSAPLLCAGLIGYRAYAMAGDSRTLGIYGFGAAALAVLERAGIITQGRGKLIVHDPAGLEGYVY